MSWQTPLAVVQACIALVFTLVAPDRYVMCSRTNRQTAGPASCGFSLPAAVGVGRGAGGGGRGGGGTCVLLPAEGGGGGGGPPSQTGSRTSGSARSAQVA